MGSTATVSKAVSDRQYDALLLRKDVVNTVKPVWSNVLISTEQAGVRITFSVRIVVES